MAQAQNTTPKSTFGQGFSMNQAQQEKPSNFSDGFSMKPL
jgi:hypothetical protein